MTKKDYQATVLALLNIIACASISVLDMLVETHLHDRMRDEMRVYVGLLQNRLAVEVGYAKKLCQNWAKEEADEVEAARREAADGNGKTGAPETGAL